MRQVDASAELTITQGYAAAAAQIDLDAQSAIGPSDDAQNAAPAENPSHGP
jgi:hypothetical protein